VTTNQHPENKVLSPEEQVLADECIKTFFNFGYELFENTKEKYPNTDHDVGWYWLTWNTPREGMWFAGPFSTKIEADEDAKRKVLPFDDPRRENEAYDGIKPGVEVKYAWGIRGTADTPLRDYEKEKKIVDECNEW